MASSQKYSCENLLIKSAIKMLTIGLVRPKDVCTGKCMQSVCVCVCVCVHV